LLIVIGIDAMSFNLRCINTSI